ncbi:MAG: TonB C-terminal domain-containing protein [Nitrospina sp.]|nr:TonB C-terminal domain-containing protein [Nitrospina sp.]
MTLTEPHVSRFNQMLVVSVLVHCLILVVFVYLPKQAIQHNVVRPAFRVQLMELPAQKAEEPNTPAPPVPLKEKQVEVAKTDTAKQPAPVEKKPVAPAKVKKSAKAKPVAQAKVLKPAPVKKTPPPPAAPKKTARARPAAPERNILRPAPVKTPAKPANNLFKELDQVAALPKQQVKPPPPAKKPDTFLEEQVRELEALKADPMASKVKPVPLQPAVQPLSKVTPAVPTEAQKKFEELVNSPVKTQAVAAPVAAQPKKELMEDLEAISRLEARTSGFKATVPMPKMPPSSSNAAGVEELESLKQELASLQKGEIKVDFQSTRKTEEAPKPAFKSQIHSLSSPDPTKVYVKATVPGTLGRNGTGTTGGTPDASVLAQYVAEIERLVMSNWKSPIGSEHKQVRASFVIYPAGKIELPKLVQSSGNEMLDNLALRAISASEPFPPFPRELKEPNLQVTVHFSYVYQE